MKRLVLAIGVLLLLGVVWLGADALYGGNGFSAPMTVTIPAGSRASSIADTLLHAGIVRSRAKFLVALKLLGKESELHPGTYELPAHASNHDIILTLSNLAAARHTEVTFPEGITSMAIAHIAAARLGCDSAKFIALVHDPVFIRALGVHGSTMEGYLLPETYVFDPPVREHDVIERMVRGMDKFLGDSLRARIASLGLTESQALTLASIVEGEAVADTERPRIAGVYWNRLKKHMKLEADPTIQYIIGSPRRLTYADLQINSPYNTYQREGLPPTPINNPGRRSILATLNPEHHEYIFFVARGDDSHTHRFSRNWAEHERAVGMYRRSRQK